MALIQYKGIGEGEIFNKWLHSRLVKHNKNVLSAELGATGSGKSYRDLRKAELWYDYHFKEKFPVENICFGVAHAMERLEDTNLRRGEVLIVEEAGVNLGSREWQSKVSRMFNHVLQSFRSMNIAIFFNLPYLSMLDSQARHLLHYYAESSGINFEKGINKCKPFFVQVAQSSGKMYKHYPLVKLKGKKSKYKRFGYSIPSQYLIDAYEQKKDAYLKKIIKDYNDKYNGKVEDRKPKIPNIRKIETYRLLQIHNGNFSVVAKIQGISERTARRDNKEIEMWLKVSKKEGNVAAYRDIDSQKIGNITSNLTY